MSAADGATHAQKDAVESSGSSLNVAETFVVLFSRGAQPTGSEV